MGCSTLYHLAKNGVLDAILLERNELTSGTTWHSAAQVRACAQQKILQTLFAILLSYMQHSKKKRVRIRAGLIKALSIATNAKSINSHKRPEALAQLFGVRAEGVGKDDALERWP